MESFEVTLNTLSFSYLTRTIIKWTAIVLAISVMAIQLILFMPFSAELKSFIFLSFGFFPSLFFLAGLAFTIIMIVTLFGGTKKFKGVLRVDDDIKFESRKLKLKLKFEDIKGVYIPQNEGSFNEWMMFTKNKKFRLTFEHLAERLRAEELLNKKQILIERKDL